MGGSKIIKISTLLNKETNKIVSVSILRIAVNNWANAKKSTH
jgi:hypothetical protein